MYLYLIILMCGAIALIQNYYPVYFEQSMSTTSTNFRFSVEDVGDSQNILYLICFLYLIFYLQKKLYTVFVFYYFKFVQNNIY